MTAVTPRGYGRRLMAGWVPWATLRESPDLTLEWAQLPTGVRGVYVDDPPTIVLDVSLSRVQRKATLGHELVHAERGICGDPRIDERGVEDEVARRLVPFDDLAAMYEIAVLNELPVEAWQIAERFDVPDAVAERAMRLFLGGQHGSG